MEEKEIDLTTDDDHSILRMNYSCAVQSVMERQGKRIVDSQKVDERYNTNLRREKALKGKTLENTEMRGGGRERERKKKKENNAFATSA